MHRGCLYVRPHTGLFGGCLQLLKRHHRRLLKEIFGTHRGNRGVVSRLPAQLQQQVAQHTDRSALRLSQRLDAASDPLLGLGGSSRGDQQFHQADIVAVQLGFALGQRDDFVAALRVLERRDQPAAQPLPVERRTKILATRSSRRAMEPLAQVVGDNAPIGGRVRLLHDDVGAGAQLVLVAQHRIDRPQQLRGRLQRRPQQRAKHDVHAAGDFGMRLAFVVALLDLRYTGIQQRFAQAHDIVGIALAGAWLPAVVTAHRSEQINRILAVTLDEQLGIDEPAIHEVNARQQVTLGQGRMDRRRDGIVRRGRRRRFDVGDEVREIIIAALTQMDLVPNPGGGAFLTIVRFRIIGELMNCPAGGNSSFVRQRKLPWSVQV